MTRHHHRARTCLACTVLLLCAAGLPAWAASSASSAVSDSVSAVSDSASNSLKKSSNSSSGTHDVADGDYRIVDVALAEDRPGAVRLTLQALATPGIEGEIQLVVPRQTLADAGLGAGRIVTAQQRSYGVEFAVAETRQAFFLALSDAWVNDLPARAVSL
jgi:hypothetical protein